MRRFLICMVLIVALALPANAESRLIVRISGPLSGLLNVNLACWLLGCQVERGLDGSLGQLFLITAPDSIGLNNLIAALLSFPGIAAVELDVALSLASASGGAIPAALQDATPVEYYGTIVRRGYVNQPAADIVQVHSTHSAYQVAGAGVVAVIDTGVDPTHPALQGVLLAGYDFTRNQSVGSEMADVNQSTAAMVDQAGPVFVNQSTAAMVDQSTAAMVDGPNFSAFGHGTLVAGIIHLVAPEARILPLKAFGSNGTGYSSDILRALYFAAHNGASVINMSFSYTEPSSELTRACEYAASRGLILVASVGNNGQQTVVYPAGLDTVMGVASTTNDDTRSAFSNYGSVVWVAGPGEGVVSTYPFATYAAAWGTSFSAPFVAGAAALLTDVRPANESQAAAAVANAQWVSYDLGNGRLDLFLAVQAWKQIATPR